MGLSPIDFQQRPKLNRGARLRFDEHSNRYVLLSPERALLLNTSAGEVVRRCDGTRTVAQIVGELTEPDERDGDQDRGDAALAVYAHASASARDASDCANSSRTLPDVAPEEISRDILQLLVDLRRKQLVQFDGLL